MAEYEDEENVPSLLLPCASCSRTFKPEALAKHSKYCEKTLIKKRRVFDSAKQRIQGTDLAEFLPVITSNKKKVEKSPVRKTQSKWKEKHMELVNAIRAARVGSSSEQVPAVPSKPVDHEQCPHCDRFFGPKAYDRHLEWCKEHSARIQAKSPASIQAKERLEARTKYRAPLLMKSRRAITKEKYQPPSKVRDPSPMGMKPQKPVSSRIERREPSPKERPIRPSVNSPHGPPKQKSTIQRNEATSPPIRGQQLRNSRRSYSPLKKGPVLPRTKNVDLNGNSSPQKDKQVSEVNDDSTLLEKGDIFSASCNISAITPKENTLKTKSKTRLSVTSAIAPPTGSVPLQVEASELQAAVKKRFGRKPPTLNDITVNDDIIGMTVYPCYPTSRPTSSNKQCDMKRKSEEVLDSPVNVDKGKNNATLGSTYVKSETLLSEKQSKNVSVDPLTTNGLDFPSVSSSVLFKESEDDCICESLILGPDVCTLDLKDNNCYKLDSSKSQIANSVDIESKETCIMKSNHESGSEDSDSVKNLRGMEKLNLPIDLINDLCDELALSDKLLNTPMHYVYTTDKTEVTSKDAISSSKHDKSNEENSKGDGANNLFIFGHQKFSGKRKETCRLKEDVSSKTPTETDDSFGPISNKRRRVNLSDSVEYLYVSSPLKYEENSVSNMYDMSSKVINTGHVSSECEFLTENGKTECSSAEALRLFCGPLSLNTELCKDCQRSKSDTDLYYFCNKGLSKCCLLRNNRMYAIRKTCKQLYDETVRSLSINNSDENINFNTIERMFQENQFYCNHFENETVLSKSSKSMSYVVEDKTEVAENSVNQENIIVEDKLEQRTEIDSDEKHSSLRECKHCDNSHWKKLTLSDLDSRFDFSEEDMSVCEHNSLLECSLMKVSDQQCPLISKMQNEPNHDFVTRRTEQNSGISERCPILLNNEYEQIATKTSSPEDSLDYVPSTDSEKIASSSLTFNLDNKMCTFDTGDVLKINVSKTNEDDCISCDDTLSNANNVDYPLTSNGETESELENAVQNTTADEDSLNNDCEVKCVNIHPDGELISDSKKVEHYEFTDATGKSIVYRTEINRVESHSWQSMETSNEQVSSYADSLEQQNILPPLKTKLKRKVPKLWVPFIKTYQNRKDSFDVTPRKSISSLTTWQQEAQRVFPSIDDKLKPITEKREEVEHPPVKFPMLVVKKDVPRQKDFKFTFSLQNYDPYKSAERQMKELLGLDDGEIVKIDQEKKQSSVALSRTNISSPTSAFVKFTPIESGDFENNFIPPASKFIDVKSLTSSDNDHSESIVPVMNDNDCVKDKNENAISLSSLSLCSTISIDSIDYGRNSFRKGISNSAKAQSCDKKVELPLKRSISAVEPNRKGRALLKSNLKMEHLLYGFSNDHYERFLGTPINDIQTDDNRLLENFSNSNESLKRSDSVDETTKAEQELIKSMFEFEKLFESPSLKPIPSLLPSSAPAPIPQPPNYVPNSDFSKQLQIQNQNTANKYNTDSAYNSLNRRSPQIEDPSVESVDTHVGSSSGSECSLPPITGQHSQIAKFCHECGAKYPISLAKFCCQCGVRRLVI